MTNAYCDLATLKSAGALNISGNGYDGRLLALLEEASRAIDAHCSRHFFVLSATRQFEAARWTTQPHQLLVPDLIAATSVRVAAHVGGLVADSAWRTAAYQLYPLDAFPEQPWGRPYTRMALAWPGVVRRDQPVPPALVEVAGRWGYRQVMEATGATLAANASAETATLTVSSGDGFSPGQTLALDDEQVYVTAVGRASLTVSRGVNGTAAAAHQKGAAISVHRYPGPVTEACLQLATHLWQLREQALVGAGVGAGVWGGNRRQAAGAPTPLGGEAAALVAPFRKLAI